HPGGEGLMPGHPDGAGLMPGHPDGEGLMTDDPGGEGLMPSHPDGEGLMTGHSAGAGLMPVGAGLMPGGAGRRSLCLDGAREALASQPRERPCVEASPDHAAYAIFTSGTTGRPKAAVNTHRAVVNRLLWMQEAYGLPAADRPLQKTPFRADVTA